MNEELDLLKEFTKECRVDMHEPDEQGISALVVGDHLDNAHGNSIHYHDDFSYQEYVVVLKKEGKGEIRINLATLIAFARLANTTN
jgi:hypothetical protein